MNAPIARIATPLVAVVVALAAPPGWAADPTAAELLARYDEIMSPPMFEADVAMTAHREDGSTRTYKMHVLKSGDDKLRSTFFEPSSAKGQEMLRNGDNLWLWMPNLKRAVRVASRDSFMGGDFNNADVLRVHYQSDYDAVMAASDDPNVYVLNLKAKNASVAYDAIELRFSKKDRLPVASKFFARSGKLLRSAQFTDVTDFGKGVVRPAHITMKNEIETARYSEMTWSKVVVKTEMSSQRFVLDDLGR